MEKPLVLSMNDFRENLAKLINESSIPVGIILDMFKSLIPELQTAAENEYKLALQLYTEASEKDNKENDK